MDGRAIGVVEGGQVFFMRTDHIGRPSFDTNDLGVKVWEASDLPFGGVHTSTGGIDLRFPGQWFQSESGLHQNWMRDYDPTTGRYIQADPLGLVDGASVYGYALQNPGRYVDPTGELVPSLLYRLYKAGRAFGSTSNGSQAAVGAAAAAGAASNLPGGNPTSTLSCPKPDCEKIYKEIDRRVKSLKRRFRHQFKNRWNLWQSHGSNMEEEQRGLKRKIEEAKNMLCFNYNPQADYFANTTPKPGGKFPPEIFLK